MALSRKQHQFITHPAKVKLSTGSIRSSKTTAQVLDWLRWLPEAPPGPLAIIGKTRDTVGRNVLDVFDQMHPGVIEWRQGAPTCRILGRLHHVLGANDAKAETKVRGLTLAGAMVDEVTLLPQDLWVTLLGRLSVEGAYLTGTTNPDSPFHWLKTEYLDRADYLAWAVFEFTMRDNPGLSRAWIAQKSKEFTGLFYDRFILGRWVAAEGAIYDMWDPARHVIAWDALPPIVRYAALGIDYGTSNATSAMLLGQTDEGRWAFVDEFRYDTGEGKRRLTDADLSRRLRAWMAEPHTPQRHQPPPPPVVVDPSAASFKQQLLSDGVRTIDANNAVLDGIRQVGSLLAADRPLLVTDRCTGFIKEAPGYAWDPKATLKGEDKPLKRNDHSMDAARYAVMQAFPHRPNASRGMHGIG